jgi:hypothetical protein
MPKEKIYFSKEKVLINLYKAIDGKEKLYFVKHYHWFE